MVKKRKLSLVLSLILTVGSLSYSKSNRILKNEIPKNEIEFLKEETPLLDLEKEIPEKDENIDTDSIPKFYIEKILLKTPRDKLIIKPLINEKKLRKILSEYENRNISILDLREVVKKLNDEYSKKGYITTRIYLEPDQNLQSGVVKLIVVEGKIEEIVLDKDTSKDKRKVFFAFTNAEDRILNISHIDNGIDNLNRVESNNSKIDIVPGEKQGYSKVVINSEKKKPVRVILNYNSTQKNKEKYSASFEYDNLLGINDILSLSYRSDKEKVFKKSKNKSGYEEGYTVDYSFPFKTWLFNLNYDKNDDKDMIVGSTHHYSLRSKSQQAGLSISKVLYRNANKKINFITSLDVKKEKTYIEGVHLSTQDKKLTVLTTGFNGLMKIFKGVASYSLTYSKGLNGFGSNEDKSYGIGTKLTNNLYPEDARNQFGKWNLNLSYYKPFYFKNQGITLRTVFVGQYTKNSLFPTEKFSIGSHGTVKGFFGSVSGDKGFNTKFEISYILPSDTDTKIGDILYKIRPYVEFDFGKVRNNYDSYGNKGSISTLSSYSLGVKYYGDILTLDLGVAKTDKGEKIMKPDKYRSYLSLTTTF